MESKQTKRKSNEIDDNPSIEKKANVRKKKWTIEDFMVDRRRKPTVSTKPWTFHDMTINRQAYAEIPPCVLNWMRSNQPTIELIANANKIKGRLWTFDDLKLNPDLYPEVPQNILNDLIKHPKIKIFRYKNMECTVEANNDLHQRSGYVRVHHDHPDFGKDHEDLNFIKSLGFDMGLDYSDSDGLYGFDCGYGSSIAVHWYMTSIDFPVEFVNLPSIVELEKFTPTEIKSMKYWTFSAVEKKVKELADIFHARDTTTESDEDK